MYLGLPKKPKLLAETLREEKDGSVTALKRLQIHIPKRFEENGFATVEDKVSSYCVVGVVCDTYYFSLTAMVKVNFTPRDLEEQTIDGTKYIVMLFEAGDTVIENTTAIMQNNAPYEFFNEFKTYARVPGYLDQPVVSSLFDNAGPEAGQKVGISPQAIRVYDSYQYRDPDDPSKQYRYSKAMQEGRPPMIVGLNKVSMIVEGTMSRVTGGYLNDAVAGSLINPSTRLTETEKVVRGKF